MSAPRYVCHHGVDLPIGVECGRCWSEREQEAFPTDRTVLRDDFFVCGKHRVSVANGTSCGLCVDEARAVRGQGVPEEPSGGKQKGNHYYRVTVRVPMSDELDPYVAECADIIEALDMTFNEGECFKALWRACRARQGLGKPGGSQMYDAEKVAHYGQRVLAHAQRCATETAAKGR